MEVVCEKVLFSDLRERGKDSCGEFAGESCDGAESKFQFHTSCEFLLGGMSCLYEASEVEEQDIQPPGYLRNVCVDDKATIKTSTTRKKASSCTL